MEFSFQGDVFLTTWNNSGLLFLMQKKGSTNTIKLFSNKQNPDGINRHCNVVLGGIIIIMIYIHGKQDGGF
jgi:hypothetical protein